MAKEASPAVGLKFWDRFLKRTYFTGAEHAGFNFSCLIQLHVLTLAAAFSKLKTL